MTAQKLKISLIAPCGMNCGLCYAYQRTKNNCPGCNSNSNDKPTYCKRCPIKLCNVLVVNKSKYCFSCKKYPCARLKHLDKRYKTKYGMSMIENLDTIKKIGIRKFVKQERERWTCPNCKSILSVHKPSCLLCKTKREIQK